MAANCYEVLQDRRAMLYTVSITLLKTEGLFHLLTLKDLSVDSVP
ncbi:hypothetical protein VAEKB19_5230017 [Vibrio aestuarianus]|nr:hypothetical protein VAEKB19_5230017 [Vibrio aestuarianus]